MVDDRKQGLRNKIFQVGIIALFLTGLLLATVWGNVPKCGEGVYTEYLTLPPKTFPDIWNKLAHGSSGSPTSWSLRSAYRLSADLGRGRRRPIPPLLQGTEQRRVARSAPPLFKVHPAQEILEPGGGLQCVKNRVHANVRHVRVVREIGFLQPFEGFLLHPGARVQSPDLPGRNIG